jgi:hypothetical protein
MFNNILDIIANTYVYIWITSVNYEHRMFVSLVAWNVGDSLHKYKVMVKLSL